MKQNDENKFLKETETGYALALLSINFLVLIVSAGFLWFSYLLFTQVIYFNFPGEIALR